MSAILADIKPGDEVIMPSYTFVSTANAFVLRGATPVFVDIRSDTLNIDESLIQAAISDKTRAIVVVHYAGIPCEMDTVMQLASANDLMVIEDAAQGIMSTYKGRPLGSIAHLATLSFHETKNIIAGEGGALLINDVNLIERAEMIREKGTNRSQFFRGMVDKYSWVDIGSSFLPGEVIAAFLWAQLEEADSITAKRQAIWNTYHQLFKGLEDGSLLRLPIVPDNCKQNAHMYYIITQNLHHRTAVIDHLKSHNIQSVFHYEPLHNSPMGKKISRVVGTTQHTENLSERLLRLPFWIGIEPHLANVVREVTNAIRCVAKN